MKLEQNTLALFLIPSTVEIAEEWSTRRLKAETLYYSKINSITVSDSLTSKLLRESEL